MKQKRRSSASAAGRSSREPPEQPLGLRIIGGRFRGRKLLYGGRRRTRPMKHRLRETIFNLLGPAVREKHALDLFAGTGALGLEAISRGAGRATLIEQHLPTAEIVRRNVAALGVQQIAQVVIANAFVWHRRGVDLGPDPWVVFCSPPYAFYLERAEEMLELIGGLVQSAPPQSVFVVEADGRFDFRRLPDADNWDVRCYPPAVVGIYRKPSQPSVTSWATEP